MNKNKHTGSSFEEFMKEESLGEQLVTGMKEAVEHSEGKLDLRTSDVKIMLDKETILEMGKALHDALQLLPPGGSVRKTVEKAYALYLEKVK